MWCCKQPQWLPQKWQVRLVSAVPYLLPLAVINILFTMLTMTMMMMVVVTTALRFLLESVNRTVV